MLIEKKQFMKKHLLITAISFVVLQPLNIIAQRKISLNSVAHEATINNFTPVDWKIKAQNEISGLQEMFKPGYNTQDWLAAHVPGTVFNDHVLAGKESDPNFGDNIYKVDRTKYNRNFWYRTELQVPPTYRNGKVWLNFEGINSKGDIVFNGVKVGTLDGFMQRGKFDVTALVTFNKPNVLSVLVYLPEEPLTNFASPTYLASASWDWMPYVPGLNSGITDDVYLSTSGNVNIEDAWMRTTNITAASANLALNMHLVNKSDSAQNGILTGIIQPGNLNFSKTVSLTAKEDKTLDLNAVMANPALWWPNGYGEPNLYSCKMAFKVNGKVSDSANITFGIRKFTYDSVGGVLHIAVNGTRIFLKGGNWGMSEYMLRCRGEEYDTKLRFHKEMNMNMIRNWLGSTTDEEFYEACDRYGMLVWDDFWLNSGIGLPREMPRFNTNVIEKIKRYRNHACLALWCGENEGVPLEPANTFLKESVAQYDLNDRMYQPCSNKGNLTGSGFWVNLDPKQYFTDPFNWGGYHYQWGLRSEIGTAVFTNFESFKKFMPQSNWWPRNDMWDKHFFGSSALNAGPDTYFSTVNDKYGTATGIEDFCRRSQLVNLETNKAMYEGWQHHIWNDASGILTWMSQSAYPSLVWQTYDYYYDCNAAYWGVKKACEPLHIQWSVADDSVKIINTTNKVVKNLKATASVYNIDGTKVAELDTSATITALKNNATYAFNLFNNENLAYKKKAYASSGSADEGTGGPEAAVDGNKGTRWGSSYSDNQWIYIDLGEAKDITGVGLYWEAAYGKAYRVQVSNDAANWIDVYTQSNGKGGTELIDFPLTHSRYVRMLGIKRGSVFGYSLWEFEVYGTKRINLTPVHFVKLELKDVKGNLVSDNFYWRGRTSDFTSLNTMPLANLTTDTTIHLNGKKSSIDAVVTNSNTAVAFTIRVQVVNAATGGQVLPVYMNDNYFTLLKGEHKNLHIEFDEALLNGAKPKVIVTQYQQGGGNFNTYSSRR